MNPFTRQLISALSVAFLAGALAEAAAAQRSSDRVKRRNGVDNGRVTAISPLGATITKSGVQSKIAVEEIREVSFSGEPRALAFARQAIDAGRYDSALEALREVDPSDVPRDGVSRQGVLSEIEFLKAKCVARLAIAGRRELAPAIQTVQKFLAGHGRSFRIPAAIELMGDLHVAAGDIDAARTQYEKLAKAKTPYFVARSAMLVGRVRQVAGAHEQAIVEFDKALAAKDGSPALELLLVEVTLDKAVSEAALGGIDDSVVRISQIVHAADADDQQLLARAYIALGDCYLAAGRSQDALFAFLHVDLLYERIGEAHAKSLHELASLWKSAGYANRADEAAQKLADDYPGSRWNRP